MNRGLQSRRNLLRGAAALSVAGLAPAILPRVLCAGVDDTPMTRRLAADLERHASFGLKFSGGPGDRATADWTVDRLRAIGYRVEVTEFDAPFFVARTTAIHTGAAAVEVFAQAPVVVSESGGINAQLALIEGDRPLPGVDGRIAVVIAPFSRHAALFPTREPGRTVRAVAQAGAVGIIIVTTGPSGEAVALNCPAQAPFVPVPAAILAPGRAQAVIEAARAGDRATLVIDGVATRRPCRNIVARLTRGRKWIAMSTPRTGWFHCVAERGTGQAAFLELAAWLEARFPRHSVFLMNTGAHEYFFAGSHRVLHQAPPPADTQVWAHIGATLAARDALQVDGAWRMLDTVDPDRASMATEKARAAVTESFAGMPGLENPGPVRPQAGELSAFTQAGYDTAFACIGTHRWFHTRGDTLDCVAADLLAPVVHAHQAIIERLVRG